MLPETDIGNIAGMCCVHDDDDGCMIVWCTAFDIACIIMYHIPKILVQYIIMVGRHYVLNAAHQIS